MHPERQLQQSILIVEDDTNARETLGDILQNEGYSTAYAVNGQEALAYLQSERPLPCLILLDLRMPVMDGWEFRKQQKQDAALASVPVVVMTGVNDTEEEALAVDAVHYFVKPYDLKALLSVIARYCSSSLSNEPTP
jgi:CheY-like chemotaxis protein